MTDSFAPSLPSASAVAGNPRFGMAMDPRKLLYFAAIIEHGSFNKAAKHLAISQPALSTSMDRLEGSLGDRLLERSPTGVSPTPLGEVVYAHARLIRDELVRAESRLNHPDRSELDAIAFGTLPSLVASIIPPAVCRWRERHDTTMLRVVENNQLDLLLGLLRGELDFIVAQTEFYDFLEGMRQRVLFRDRLYVLARPGHPVLDLKAPSWKTLASFPWVVQMVGRQRMLLEKLLAAEEAELPRQLTESGSVGFIKSLVAGTDSLAVLPAAAVDKEVREGTIVPLELDEPLLNRDIAVLFREGVSLPPAARDLLQFIEESGAALGVDPLHAPVALPMDA